MAPRRVIDLFRLQSRMWSCPMLNCTQQPEDAWCQDENILLIRAMRDSNVGISYFTLSLAFTMVFAMLSQQRYTKPCDCYFQSRIQTHRCTCTFAAFTIHIDLLFTVHYIASSMTQCFQSKGTCMFSYQHPTQWGAKVLVRWLAPLLRNRERSLPWHWGGCHQKDSPDVSNTSTASCFCLCWIRRYRR